MGEKLFEKGMNINEVVKKINEIVKKKFNILDEEDNDLEKWTSVPKLLLLDDVAQKRLLTFIEYMDSSELPIEQKVMVVVSLSGLVDSCSIKLYDYDDGSLYLLADYYQNTSFKNIKKTLPILKNQDLLFEIRKQTLDLEDRKKILSVVEKKIINDKIDTADSNSIKKFIKKEIEELNKSVNYN